MSESQSKRNRKPPVNCTPCRVTFQGIRYQIEKNGDVRTVSNYDGVLQTPGDVRKTQPIISSVEAAEVRREASRQRRNRNARERTAAMKDLGLKRGTGGAFGGGWE